MPTMKRPFALCYVHPDVQDKGLGTLMAMTLESVARQEGVKRVTCSAREDAVEFFAKLGVC